MSATPSAVLDASCRRAGLLTGGKDIGSSEPDIFEVLFAKEGKK
jgi:hypothetical protein